MSIDPDIYKFEVSGEEVKDLIEEKLGPAVDGEAVPLAILTMLTFSIMLMKPDIDVEELKDIVMSTSGHIIQSLTQAAEFEEPKVMH